MPLAAGDSSCTSLARLCPLCPRSLLPFVGRVLFGVLSFSAPVFHCGASLLVVGDAMACAQQQLQWPSSRDGACGPTNSFACERMNIKPAAHQVAARGDRGVLFFDVSADGSRPRSHRSLTSCPSTATAMERRRAKPKGVEFIAERTIIRSGHSPERVGDEIGDSRDLQTIWIME